MLAALVDSLSWTEQEGKKTIERVDISSYDSFMNNKRHANSSSNNVSLHLPAAYHATACRSQMTSELHSHTSCVAALRFSVHVTQPGKQIATNATV